MEEAFSRKHEDKRVEINISGTLFTAKNLVILKSECKYRVSLLVGLMNPVYSFLYFSFRRSHVIELIVMTMNSHFNICR